jgi:hypothetical protein
VDIKNDQNPLPCISCCLYQGPKNTVKIRSQIKHFLQYIQPKLEVWIFFLGIRLLILLEEVYENMLVYQ